MKDFPLGEDSKNQFKSDINSIDQLAVEISAFANSQGGTIWIGFSDRGQVVGLTSEKVHKINQWISNASSTKVEPPVYVETEIQSFEGKMVLIVSVPVGISKPYSVNKSEFWVKNGADKRRASRDELFRLFQSSNRMYADEMTVPCGLDAVDWLIFSDYYQSVYGENVTDTGVERSALMSNLKLMEGNQLTLAGLMLFGKNPERIRPQFGIKATCFTDPDHFSEKKDICGNLFKQYQDALQFVMRNIPNRATNDDDFNAPTTPVFPEPALAEVIANSIIHRDYFINSQVMLNVWPDMVEILSPGTLPNTITVENIKMGIHLERNPILLSYLGKWKGIGYTGRGSGIPRVIRLCEEQCITVDLINDTDLNRFIVRLKTERKHKTGKDRG